MKNLRAYCTPDQNASSRSTASGCAITLGDSNAARAAGPVGAWGSETQDQARPQVGLRDDLRVPHDDLARARSAEARAVGVEDGEEAAGLQPQPEVASEPELRAGAERGGEARLVAQPGGLRQHPREPEADPHERSHA